MSIVPRDRWCTVPQASWWRPTRLRLPLGEVWLHHGAAGTSSVATANGYAGYHIRTKNWGELGYSFVIAAGTVLEGRGAGVAGAHTYGRNDVSHGICVAGDYTSREPSPEDLDALVWLLRHGHDQGWWPSPTLTGGHRDAPGASTSCPGDRLQQSIPHINRTAQEDQMNADQDARLKRVEQLLADALDREKRPSLWRDVDATKQAVGRVDAAIPDLPGKVAAEVAASLPSGTVDADVLAAKVADVLAARLRS